MSQGDARTPRKVWMLCLLLFAATTLNYQDRQTMSILAPTVQKEMLDRSNLRWAFAASVFAWSIVAGLTSLSNGFAALLVFRLLLGVAESENWPAALRIVARALPPEERPLGNGIFTSGVSRHGIWKHSQKSAVLACFRRYDTGESLPLLQRELASRLFRAAAWIAAGPANAIR